MLIDDSSIDRFIAEKVIRQTYFANEILSMPHARLALDHLATIKDEAMVPNLIFLDIYMPEMDGFQFLEQYAKLPDLVRKRNILMLSSSITPVDLNRASSDPYVFKFLEKPITAV